MTILTQLGTLADVLEAATEVDRIAITAGRPAAPSDEEVCTAIYVFADNLTDLNQTDEDACAVRSRLALEFEIWVCYPEDWEDVTAAEHLTAAENLYTLMGDAWCALVEAKDAGTFGDCGWVELTSFDVQARGGGAVSALGGVTLSYDCTPTSP